MKMIKIVILALTFNSFFACAQSTKTEEKATETIVNKTENKMKVEIWSDIVCPFCYIGKTNFEKALAAFPHKDDIEVVWKSYQLSPNVVTDASKNYYEALAAVHGSPVEEVKQRSAGIVEMAKNAGLEYNFDKAVFVNSLKAHHFIHFAKQYHKENEAQAILFRSLFTDGKNIDDIQTLVALGNQIGLTTSELKLAIENRQFTKEIQADIAEAREIGVRGVPFFVFSRKSAVSGAQGSEAFTEVLEKEYTEWRKENPKVALNIINGKSCSTEEECN